MISLQDKNYPSPLIYLTETPLYAQKNPDFSVRKYIHIETVLLLLFCFVKRVSITHQINPGNLPFTKVRESS